MERGESVVRLYDIGRLRAEEDDQEEEDEDRNELNNNYNKTVDQLVETVSAVSKMYEVAQEAMDNPALVASIDLNKIRAADAALDEEIEQLMQVYFEKNEVFSLTLISCLLDCIVS